MKKLTVYIVLIFLNHVLYGQAISNQKPLKIFKKQEGSIVALSFQGDGKVLASGSEDKTCVLFSFPDGKILNTLTGFSGGVRAIFYTPDGKYLGIGGDRTVRVFNPNGEYINAFTGPATYIWSLSFNPVLNQIVCGSYDKNLRIIDFASGKLIYSLMGHTKNALAVAFSPNGKLIASGSLDESIKLWDPQTKKEVYTLTGHGGNIYAILFSSNSNFLFSASNDNSIRVWDVNTGHTIHHLIGHDKGVSCISVSPDGTYLLSGSYDGTLKLWDWINDECIATYDDASGEVNTVSFHPDGNLFVSGSSDKIIRIWELKPDVFVDHYYKKAFEDELNQSPLFLPKAKDEPKTDYKIRQEQAVTYRNALIQKYFLLYQTEYKGKVRPKP